MERFVRGILEEPSFAESLAHYEYLPAQGARHGEPPAALDPRLRGALGALGLSKLYSHQVRALELALAGAHVVAVAPTGSGKSLSFNLPVFQRLLAEPGSFSLYLYPLKALAQDQLRSIRQLADALGGPLASGGELDADVYDGDTPESRRRKLRQRPPRILITNPDMLHHGLLPFHEGWREFFAGLRAVVVDELHTYRGIFGGHVALVLRRLRRVCGQLGSEPQFLASSATLSNPAELAGRLTGLPFAAVEEDGAPRAPRHFLMLNPTLSPATLACRLFARALLAGFKTIVFTKGRRAAELISTWTLQSHPELRGRVSSYRAGFLPEERRQVEGQLQRGGLSGVVSTSALELGVDIGGLDVCILVGYPGSIINTWQRGGRVGRGGRESLIALIAERDALDQYLVSHPEDFFGRPFERAALDPENPYLLAQHLPCAAAELPLGGPEPALPPAWRGAAARLEGEGELLRSAEGERWFAARKRPHREVDLRGSGESFAILAGEEPIGEVNGHQAFAECHPGAIYLHRGRQYEVEELDLERRNVRVRPSEARYFTRARSEKETEILTRERSRTLGNARLHLGRLRVTTRVTGYEKRSTARQGRLGVHPLELPPTTFETVGFWVELEEGIARRVAGMGLHFMGGIHAAEHAAIGLFPLFALCERDDLGGISTPFHPQVGRGAIFFYDGHPGGVGLAEQGFEQAEELFAKTLEVVERCPCEEGCPSCVHSPKCGSGNYPLDKEAAKWVLRMVLGREALPPSEEAGEADAPPLEPAAAESPLSLSGCARSPRVLVLDLETKRSAEEVGGWGRADRMGLACAVLWRWPDGASEVFLEEQAPSLLAALRGADLVVGFNVLGFDYQVLRGYCGEDLSRSLPTLDILRDLAGRLGFRPSLGSLAQATLGEAKGADGLQSLAWWRAGERRKVLDYCRADAALTGGLFRFGLERGHLILELKGRGKVRVPVDWTLDGLLERARAETAGPAVSRFRK